MKQLWYVLGGATTIISGTIAAWLFLETQFVTASEFYNLKTSQYELQIEGFRREQRQLLREKRRAPAVEKHYFDEDVKSIDEKISNIKRRIK